MPRAASTGTQAPSDPSRAQLPPPRASTTASASARTWPVGVSKTSDVEAPWPVVVSSHPTQRQRMWNVTGTAIGSATPAAPSTRPAVAPWRSRCIHARSSGAAFMSAGKIRPDVPTKVSTPSPLAQSRTFSAPNVSSHGAIMPCRAPYRLAKMPAGSECVKFRPPLPASKNLRPTDGMAS